MQFVQIVEFKTSDIEAMQARGKRYEEETGGGAGSAIFCADRDNPGTFLVIATFPSYEEAMANSEKPETQALAADMMALSDAPPTFRNLDLFDTLGG